MKIQHQTSVVCPQALHRSEHLKFEWWWTNEWTNARGRGNNEQRGWSDTMCRANFLLWLSFGLIQLLDYHSFYRTTPLHIWQYITMHTNKKVSELKSEYKVAIPIFFFMLPVQFILKLVLIKITCWWITWGRERSIKECGNPFKRLFFISSVFQFACNL